MRLNIELRPIQSGTSKFTGEPYYEPIIWVIDGYPAAILHVDTLHTKGGNEIYDKLIKGETVKVTADFQLVAQPEIIPDYDHVKHDPNSPWLLEED